MLDRVRYQKQPIKLKILIGNSLKFTDLTLNHFVNKIASKD